MQWGFVQAHQSDQTKGHSGKQDQESRLYNYCNAEAADFLLLRESDKKKKIKISSFLFWKQKAKSSQQFKAFYSWKISFIWMKKQQSIQSFQ